MLAFIDESGHPHPNDPAFRPVLLSLCFSETESRRITRLIYALKKRWLSSPDQELHARSILNPRTFRRIPEKRELVEQIFDNLRHLPIGIFAVVMERPQAFIPTEEGKLGKQHRFLIERVNKYCEAFHPDEQAILVFDGQDQRADAALSSSLNNFVFRSDAGKALSHIVDTPFFVSSAIVTGIQLADLAAAVVRRYYELDGQNGRSDEVFAAAIRRYYGVIQEKTHEFDNDFGTTDYGIYKAPSDF